MKPKPKFCPHCGEPAHEGAVFCTHCGRRLRAAWSGPSGEPKSRVIALLLCLFTGCGHKFYEGDIGMGLIYMFTGALFGIGWLIDLLTYASMTDDTYYVD